MNPSATRRRAFGAVTCAIIAIAIVARQDLRLFAQADLWKSDIERLSILSRIWIPNLDGLGLHRHITVTGSADGEAAMSYLAGYGPYFEGQLYYVRADDGGGATTVLHRRYADPIHDFLDEYATTPSVGYLQHLDLGNVYNSSEAGMCMLRRWVDTNSGHMLGGCGENWGGTYGYTPEEIGGYGFPRYTWNALGPDPDPRDSISNGTITLATNPRAGGAVFQLYTQKTLSNGSKVTVSYLNNWDYGRELSMAFFIPRPVDVHGVSDGRPGEVPFLNPTEPGDTYGWQHPSTPVHSPVWANPVTGVHRPTYLRYAHGSYQVSRTVSGENTPLATLQTQTVPLEFAPAVVADPPGDIDHPVRYKGLMGKSVSIGLPGHPRIMRWDATINLMRPTHYLDWEIATAFLHPAFHDVYLWHNPDPTNQSYAPVYVSTDVPQSACSGPSYQIPGTDPPLTHEFQGSAAPGSNAFPVARGLIMSHGDDAIAFYKKSTAAVGAVFLPSFCREDGGSFSTDAHDIFHLKGNMRLVFDSPDGSVSFAAGPHTETVYIVAGTLEEVIAELRWLDGPSGPG